MASNYKMNDPEGIYFCSFATVQWVDIFTRRYYKDILVDNLRVCQEEKGLRLFAWVIMSNHVHLIAGVNKGNLAGMLRDYKSFTSKKLYEAIKTEPESRRDWMLPMFEKAGRYNPNNKNFQIWQQDNQPKELLPYYDTFTKQKLNYIHQNPVEAGWVDLPEDYTYSSARSYCGMQGLLDVELLC